ncbi:glycoside hydrolase [Stieleria sp. JC731]|nr:sialidase family protein [Stieleria sp. JC731]MCC9602992.1 glycoside hydrolase [Stieleria sp. JC731]
MRSNKDISSNLDRRTVLAASLGTLALGKFAHCVNAQLSVLDVKTISPTPNIYCGWPTLILRRNGQLMLVWSGGRESHVCPFGRVDMMRSDDQGETWTWPRTILDGASDDRDAGALETDQGTLIVTTFTSLAYESIYKDQIARQKRGDKNAWPEDQLARWSAVHNRMSDNERDSELGQWAIRSTDEGRTWSNRIPTIVNSPHGPIQLSDGRLLYPGKELWTTQKRIGASVSTDDGQSWQWLAEIPTRDGDKATDYHELHGVECQSGKLVVHIRNHNPKNNRETLQTESTDGGETWTVPHSIGIWGLPSHLLRLKDGRLLMSYGHRRDPLGIQVRISDDEGTTWSDSLPIWDQGTSGDLGYPSTVELDDGSLVSVWYEKMKSSPKAVLRQARWRV